MPRKGIDRALSQPARIEEYSGVSRLGLMLQPTRVCEFSRMSHFRTLTV